MRRALAAFALALCLASAARAAPRIDVSPVTLEISAARPIAVLRLRNESPRAVAFEARALAWTQQNGVDRLTPTQDVVLFPPAFVMAAGAEQIVRVGAPQAGEGAGAQERAFRVLLTQAALQDGAEPGGLRVRMQFSLPLFLAPAHPDRDGAPAITFAGAGAARVVRIANPTNRRLALAGLALEGLAAPAPPYLLAGQSVERPAPAARRVSIAYATPEAGAFRTRKLDAAADVDGRRAGP